MIGVVFAFVALACWGLGDFLIQRSARAFGSWVALFYVTAFGTVVLLPFVYHDLFKLLTTPSLLWFLLFTSVIILVAAVLDFEALRQGKISVIEPIYAMEIPVTASLAAWVIHEYLLPLQLALITALVAGIMLVSTRSWRLRKRVKRHQLEKGVWYAVLATMAMGAVNFLFGQGARLLNPLLVNWFTSFFIAVAMFGYLICRGEVSSITRHWRSHKQLILSVGFFDNLAWIAFTYATVTIPIAIATGISESYIALAAGLGLWFNREKLKLHQLLGLALAIIAVVWLASIT